MRLKIDKREVKKPNEMNNGCHAEETELKKGTKGKQGGGEMGR